MKTIGTLFFGMALGLAPYAHSCACVGMESTRVLMGNQKNVIVWDAEKKVEHFYRIASFQTKSEKIGFIAPTPSIPDIGEGDPAVMEYLNGLFPMPTTADKAEEKSAPEEPEVEVVKEVETKNFSAVVLRATDAVKLRHWLTTNRFTAGKDIDNWLDYYIKKNWYLTAFKYKSTEGQVVAPMARLSFKTDKPYNPYFVPKVNQKDPAGLTVFFISKGQYAGQVGGAKWSNEEKRIDLEDNDRAQIAKMLELPVATVGNKLQMFNDWSFPSDATSDIFFDKVAESTPFQSDVVDKVAEAHNSSPLVIPGIMVLGALGYTTFIIFGKRKK
jgi:hypothetical protein